MADIIKDDFIKRSDALLAAFDLNLRDCSALLNNGIPYQHIKNALLAIKAIDVQPVVRCKDCEYYRENKHGYCSFFDEKFMPFDGYCSNGVKMDGRT